MKLLITLLANMVRNQAHTNGIESFRSMLKRGYQGTFHYFSEKYMNRYVGEFLGPHNVRELDTVDHLTQIAHGMTGRRLRYQDFVR